MSWRRPFNAPQNITLERMIGGAMIEGSGAPGNGARVTNASGSITIPMLGNKVIGNTTLVDLDDANCIYGVMPLVDIYGNPVTGDKRWSISVGIDFPDGNPATDGSDHCGAALWIVNSNSPSGATIDGVGCCIEYTAANPNVRYVVITNGTVTAASGSATATVKGVQADFSRRMTAAGNLGTLTPSLGVAGVDSAGILVSGGGVTTSAAISAIGTGAWYAIVGVYRTTTDADNISISPRFRVSRVAQLTW